MRQRVRGLLLEPGGRIVTYRRVRPDRPLYWVLPGGHVEPRDEDFAAALDRELYEELGGSADIDRLVEVTREGPEHFQYIFLGRIETWSLPDRTGEEFDDPANGEYLLDLITPTAAALRAINLHPDVFAHRLIRHLDDGGRIEDLPLRAPDDAPTNPVR